MTCSQAGRRAVAALAQHFRVVDLAQLDVPPGHRRPQPRDAALGADVFRRPSKQEQELAPRLDIAAGIDAQLANQVVVQQRRELGNRGVRTQRRPCRPAAARRRGR